MATADLPANTAEIDATVPLKSRIIHKFYEPLVLRKALSQASQNRARHVSSEPIDMGNLQQLSFALVYKIAHVCDDVKGESGASVTSFAVLQSHGNTSTVQYWFASNQRTHEQLEGTKTFIRDLLRLFQTTNREPLELVSMHRTALRHVLQFNKPRLKFYLETLGMHLRQCLAQSLDGETGRNHTISRALEGLLQPQIFPDASEESEDQFVRGCEIMIDELLRLQTSRAGLLIIDRSKEGRMPGHTSQECWSELQHTISRIIAYHYSVQCMIRAREEWPALFENFEVHFIPSSTPMERFKRNKSLSADGIVGRMTRKVKVIEQFRRYVETLQGFDLDQRIVSEYQNPSFRPVVHSEVLLLDWLKNSGRLTPEHFFNGWMYIGTSKPPCTLCQYYFEEHQSGVAHRPSHGNLYINWRLPDVLVSQGPAAENDRQVMLDRVLNRIRKDTFDLVKKKVPFTYKEHDSNTFSPPLTHGTWTSDQKSTRILNDAALQMGQLSLSD
ncbi:uncharacterized protein JN550_007537 [Neoarthrinium moseri]|uniref:uncharacterized protein n=1 Tax=Neoarthrinium moseri TaxID=1658444 RepID=UPI001FDDB9AA|nr:uncharacterized protein JN550_007537 [Neoarthrinium moseri]KAI1866684.1 hypothetical protein JN550_007537 [Neoarthrinium moseri]